MNDSSEYEGGYERTVGIWGWWIKLCGNYKNNTHFFQTTYGLLGPYESGHDAEVAARQYWADREFGIDRERPSTSSLIRY